ncbi:MAG: heavy metal translocating P-type ATPase [Sphaerochaetaceae bacterium]|nr:heavy metal translocating P-type ATPase [Sphaerochaetaceae bacterium]
MRNIRVYNLKGIDCPSCAIKIEEAVKKIDGVESLNLNPLNGRFEVSTTHQEVGIFDNLVKETIAKVDPAITTQNGDKPLKREWTSFLVIPARVVVSLTLLGLAIYFQNSNLAYLFYLLSYLASGYDILLKALKNLFRGVVFDENFLMTIATIGAFAIGQHSEAVAVMAFYQVGEFFQSLAVYRSKRSISALIDLKAVTATVLREGQYVTVPVEEIEKGETFVVRSGEKIPLDGVVKSGSSLLNTSALTGESLPVAVSVGSKVLSGSINGSGALQVVASGTYAESTVALILKMVEESTSRKTESERFITRFAKVYTPIVVLLALLLATIPPLFSPLPFALWLYRALVFLVISCPCALVVSVPLAFFAGIGALARMGVLVKGSNYLQLLSETKVVVFDKTGTLTKGQFSYNGMKVRKNSPYSEEELLQWAASLEHNSTHPIGRAIVDSFDGDLLEVTNVVELPGVGIEGHFEEHYVKVGLGERKELSISVDGVVEATLFVADSIKEEAKESVEELRKLGVERVVLLSGDSAPAVAQVAQAVGIEEYYSRLLPQDKVAHIERLLGEKSPKSSLVFVGDGINDAPVLARSDIGVSMGQLGSDAAIEASDVVIMEDHLKRLPQAIRSSRRTLSIVRQNIALALIVKGAILILGALGWATMWMAVFGDTGVALLAILNGLRALKRL